MDGFAPFSLGCPKMTQVTDYSIFKQSPEDKLNAIAFKTRHKLFLEKHGIDGKRFLNIPDKRLEKTIITT